MFNLMDNRRRKLTKNEKEVICCLLDNARMHDVEIARKLRITTQAVGKIRKRLEKEGIIESYSARINYTSVGINVFAVAMIRASPRVWSNGIDAVRKKLGELANIVYICRVARTDISIIAVFGFKNLAELEDYFHNIQQDDVIGVTELFTFSARSLLKQNINGLVRYGLGKCRGGKNLSTEMNNILS